MKKAPVNEVRDAAIRVLQGMLPDVSWLLRHAEKEDNWIRFPPTIARAISGGLGNYVDLYEDERRIVCATFLGMFGDEGGREMIQVLSEMEIAEMLQATDEVAEEWGQYFDAGFRLPRTDEELEAARKALEALPKNEQEAARRQGALFLGGFLATFFQYISLMVHGEKLTALVGRALAGDTDAMTKAVQIDRNLLSYHKVFRQKMSEAQLAGDAKFLDSLAYRLRNPIAKGKIRYRELWFALSVLDGLGMLKGQYRHIDLVNLLAESGLDLRKNGIEDEGYFAKRLRDYRRFQQRAARTH